MAALVVASQPILSPIDRAVAQRAFAAPSLFLIEFCVRDVKGCFAGSRIIAEMRPGARLTEGKIATFVEVMRANVLAGDVSFRRAWLRAMIDNVEVDDTEIRIHGKAKRT